MRVRAAEIRKRLAQYYQSSTHPNTKVRIALPVGSYRAVFQILPQESSPPSLEKSTGLAAPGGLNPVPIAITSEQKREIARPYYRKRGLWAAVALIAIIVLAGLARPAFYTPAPNVLEQFWAPVLGSSKPVIIYGGADAVYHLSNSFLDHYRKEHHLENQGPEFFVNFRPGEKIDASDLMPVTDDSVDMKACALMVSLLTRYRRPFEIRYGSDITAGDLIDSPTILIGAFNNSWTMNITHPLRFVFRNGDRIEDTWGRTKGWSIVPQPNGATRDDYAIISRLLDLKTGQVVISVAGIGSSGTEAAAQFLTNPLEMAVLAQSAPRAWQKMNMQVVLHVEILDNALTKENVVATQYW